MQSEPLPQRFPESAHSTSIAVIGGGLAGVSAALEAYKRGARVVLFERLKRLGGRAGSIRFGTSDAVVDVGEHTLFNATPHLDRFHAELCLAQYFDRIAPAFARSSGFSTLLSGINRKLASRLPTNVRVLSRLFERSPFSFKRTWNLYRTFRRISKEFVNREASSNSTVAVQPNGANALSTFADALRFFGASESEIRDFWRSLTLATAVETPEEASYEAVSQIIESFVSQSRAFTEAVPTLPLCNIYNDLVLKGLRERGIETRLNSRVERFILNDDDSSNDSSQRAKIVGLSINGEIERFDKFVLAIDPFAAQDILERSQLFDVAQKIETSHCEYASITGVHLWLSRPLTSKRATLLSGAPAQKLFTPVDALQPLPEANSNQKGYYCQALISGSHRLLADDEFVSRGTDALVSRVWRQLAENFKFDVGANKALAARVTTAIEAVVSPTPQFYSLRPNQKTRFENLTLAGDWTATGLPSSMESAVKSGALAIEALYPKTGKASNDLESN